MSQPIAPTRGPSKKWCITSNMIRLDLQPYASHVQKYPSQPTDKTVTSFDWWFHSVNQTRMLSAFTHHNDYCNIQNKFCTTSMCKRREMAECLKTTFEAVTNCILQFHSSWQWYYYTLNQAVFGICPSCVLEMHESFKTQGFRDRQCLHHRQFRKRKSSLSHTTHI